MQVHQAARSASMRRGGASGAMGAGAMSTRIYCLPTSAASVAFRNSQQRLPLRGRGPCTAFPTTKSVQHLSSLSVMTSNSRPIRSCTALPIPSPSTDSRHRGSHARYLRMTAMRSQTGRHLHYSSECASSIQNSWSHLKNRAVIEVSGEDAISFLQGLTTNDMNHLRSQKSMLSAFLNAQGRVMHDALLVYSEPTNSIFIDVASDQKQDFLKLLKRYKLRAKVALSDHSDSLKVYAAVGPDAVLEKLAPGADKSEICLLFQDPRLRELGVRLISSEAQPFASMAGFNEISDTLYDIYRISLGVAQGPKELPQGSCLPLEGNIELFGGVSFNKGCYVGQELTARSHFRGQIRKRLIPFVITDSSEGDSSDTIGTGKTDVLETAIKFDKEALKSGESVEVEGKGSIGKVIYMDKGIGLAMIRLQNAMANFENLGKIRVGNYNGSLILPAWWDGIAEQERARETQEQSN